MKEKNDEMTIYYLLVPIAIGYLTPGIIMTSTKIYASNNNIPFRHHVYLVPNLVAKIVNYGPSIMCALGMTKFISDDSTNLLGEEVIKNDPVKSSATIGFITAGVMTFVKSDIGDSIFDTAKIACYSTGMGMLAGAAIGMVVHYADYFL